MAALITGAATIVAAAMSSRALDGPPANLISSETLLPETTSSMEEFLDELRGITLQLRAESQEASATVNSVDLASALLECTSSALVLRDLDSDGNPDEGVFLGFSVFGVEALPSALPTADSAATLKAMAAAAQFAAGVDVAVSRELVNDETRSEITAATQATLRQSAVSSYRVVNLGDDRICFAVELVLPLR
jgi:hypothetical protein